MADQFFSVLASYDLATNVAWWCDQDFLDVGFPEPAQHKGFAKGYGAVFQLQTIVMIQIYR